MRIVKVDAYTHMGATFGWAAVSLVPPGKSLMNIRVPIRYGGYRRKEFVSSTLMTPTQFLRRFRVDNRLERGTYFSPSGVTVEHSDHVGVVLVGLGGPRDRSEFESYLYARRMDPVLFGRGLGVARDAYVRMLSRASAHYLWKDYEEIGGECPSVRLIREQASALERRLNAVASRVAGVRFSTYVSLRYGSPSPEDTVRSMDAAGVKKVVLLPIHPEYSLTTTGTSLAYWAEMMSDPGLPSRPTAAVIEYAAHPLYIQALSERIDQALQRFPKRVRPNVEIVFCAEHVQANGRLSERDSFCDLAQTTVSQLENLRNHRQGYELACFTQPSTRRAADQRYIQNVLQRLAGRRIEALLAVPLGHSTDHVWTANTLDIQLRQAAGDLGIGLFEVASGLNCHPLFISAMADIVATQLSPADQLSTAQDAGVGNRTYAVTVRGAGRISGCPTCRGPVRARDWGSAPPRSAFHP